MNDFTRESVQSADGTEIGYYTIGNGPPLVIIHGSIATAEEWGRVAGHLSSDFTCYVYDRRGRAHSGDDQEYSMKKEVEDLEAMRSVAGADAALVGHSYGALCVLNHALMYDHSASMVLFEPPLPVNGPVAGASLPRFARAIEDGDNARGLEIAFTEIVGMPAEAVEALKQSPGWESLCGLAPTWSREFQEIDELGEDITRYRELSGRPIHILCGTATTQNHLESAEQLHVEIGGSHLDMLEGVDHFAHALAPDQLSQGILNALPST